MTSTERPAVDGEFCTCGRPAVRVYLTEKWGGIGDCDVHPARPVVPCRFCGGKKKHEPGVKCPRYSLRADAGAER